MNLRVLIDKNYAIACTKIAKIILNHYKWKMFPNDDICNI